MPSKRFLKWFQGGCCLPLAAAALLTWHSPAARADVPAAKPTQDERLARLVAELGSPHFAARERAASELAELGLEAFDALLDGQDSRDIEIAERSRYLMNSLEIELARASDPPAVKRLLKDYGRQSSADNQSRIQSLADLDDAQGLDALCRIVRYEKSNLLAKQAALVILSKPEFAEQAAREALRKSVAERVAASRRTAATWLTTYISSLDRPADTFPVWQKLVEDEKALYRQMPDRQSSAEIVTDLYRWHATYCQKLGRSDDALAAIRQMVEFSDGSREDLLDIVDWLLVQKLWTVVDEVARKHEAKFAADAELLYRWAESQRAAGDARLAEETAQRAHGLAAGDTQRSFVLAERLQERGMLDWCERELRAIIGRVEMVSREGVVARSMLAELLHDQEKEDGAADALADLIKAAEANSVTAEIAGSLTGRSIEELQSRMYYFAALAHLQKGKRDEAKTALEKGLAANDEDADLLIGMHRFPGADEEWRKRTSRHIAEAARNFKEIIDRAQSNLEQAELEAPQEQYKLYAAIFCNQYAWLVGNTEGDIQEAIRLSQLSLELRPGTGGYMDTLAHCYFRAGDLENAVRWQRKAIALEPHSQQMVRALARFEKALAEQKSSRP